MRRNLRLTSKTDFKRVRRNGKSYAHPLAVLIACPNELDRSRFGVIAGRGLGGAVHRNRAKRRLREAVRSIAPRVQAGWDLLLIARRETLEADWQLLKLALVDLLDRAGLWESSGAS